MYNYNKFDLVAPFAPFPYHFPVMFAVVGRGLYADADPVHFGNILMAMFTLFQLLTLDDWFEIYEDVCAGDSSKYRLLNHCLPLTIMICLWKE